MTRDESQLKGGLVRRALRSLDGVCCDLDFVFFRRLMLLSYEVHMYKICLIFKIVCVRSMRLKMVA